MSMSNGYEYETFSINYISQKKCCIGFHRIFLQFKTFIIDTFLEAVLTCQSIKNSIN